MDVKEGTRRHKKAQEGECLYFLKDKQGRQAVSNQASDSAALLVPAAIGSSYSERTVAERQAAAENYSLSPQA